MDQFNHENNRIHLSISTRFLIRIAMRRKHICTDATHNLNYKRLPIFLTGTTDKRKKFHPFTLSICTRETSLDFEFIFRALMEALFKLYEYHYKPVALVECYRAIRKPKKRLYLQLFSQALLLLSYYGCCCQK